MRVDEISNHMTFGEPDAYSLPAEEIKVCGELLSVSTGMSGTVFTHLCQEPRTPGMCKCVAHGLKECAELREEADRAIGTRYEWRPQDIAGLAAEEAAYREADAR